MLVIGTQISSAKGFENIGKDALRIGANTFQFFMRNPRGTKAKEIKFDDIGALQTLLEDNKFGKIIAHAPYTLNACSQDAHLRGLSTEMFADDLSRMEHLPGNYYNVHPGSHTGQDRIIATGYIANMLNAALRHGQQTTVLLETMSGKGSEIGSRFEELYDIMEKVALSDRLGICFDACHMWDAGYNIGDGLDSVLDKFDRIIGLKALKAFHINDSKNPCGSKKDRHATLGDGYIGLDAIIRIINHPLLRNLPFILETPIDLESHAEEIRLLREAYQ